MASLLSICLVLGLASASAFVPPPTKPVFRHTALTASNEGQVRREHLLDKTAGLSAVLGLLTLAGNAGEALAVRDYEGVPYLGGSDKIDINNVNIRTYSQLRGVYPTLASKIVKNGPYNKVDELYQIKDLTPRDKELLNKYSKYFTAMPPREEYTVDRINDGMYAGTSKYID
ncbi:unnamed protein product [Vitrella brassicaformis CCMP3155]|uniref:Photosystem II 12 kDa extrinsic protein n=1 Tax=Vitrella brassicaformis (strain CCMP3155) TaxID=1169540 RepID=A0A0G4H3V8_VITBC|nr:unnamed protein product [Vitrella brassicaformis CCMP3155]|eukprot:CEM38385.1 unnamed protein product [Vitrella brassicaformis CCMP3155]